MKHEAEQDQATPQASRVTSQTLPQCILLRGAAPGLLAHPQQCVNKRLDFSLESSHALKKHLCQSTISN